MLTGAQGDRGRRRAAACPTTAPQRVVVPKTRPAALPPRPSCPLHPVLWAAHGARCRRHGCRPGGRCHWRAYSRCAAAARVHDTNLQRSAASSMQQSSGMQQLAACTELLWGCAARRASAQAFTTRMLAAAPHACTPMHAPPCSASMPRPWHPTACTRPPPKPSRRPAARPRRAARPQRRRAHRSLLPRRRRGGARGARCCRACRRRRRYLRAQPERRPPPRVPTGTRRPPSRSKVKPQPRCEPVKPQTPARTQRAADASQKSQREALCAHGPKGVQRVPQLMTACAPAGPIAPVPPPKHRCCTKAQYHSGHALLTVLT